MVNQDPGGGNSNMFGIFIPYLGEDEPIFDEHIFQMGWFNHQPEEFPMEIPSEGNIPTGHRIHGNERYVGSMGTGKVYLFS